MSSQQLDLPEAPPRDLTSADRGGSVLRTRLARATGFSAEGRGRVDIRRRDALKRRGLLLADAVAAVLAIDLAIGILGREDSLSVVTLLAAPFVVLVSKIIGLYERDELVLRSSTLDEAPALFQVATLYTLVFWLLENQLVTGTLGKSQILGLWVALFALTLTGRVLARRVTRRLVEDERCMVVGDVTAARTIAGKLEGDHSLHAYIAAEIPLDLEDGGADALRRLEDVIERQRPHRVIVAPRSSDSAAVLDAVRLVKSLGVKVSLLPRLLEVVGSSVVFDDVHGATVLGVRRFGLTRSSALVKRALDVSVAAVGLLAVAPLFVACALAIRLTSSGPVFFRQVRIGRGGRPFEMLKFRTMVDGAEGMKAALMADNESTGLFKLTDDPRVTRVGRVLRQSSLDELPQLLNVLFGDMSLVGPRPLVVSEDALVHGWHRRRLHLTPGMTGPWQILGSRQVPLAEMVKIDYLYIANWSFWIDVKILVRTALHVLNRRGV